jgi:hypothetical protein
VRSISMPEHLALNQACLAVFGHHHFRRDRLAMQGLPERSPARHPNSGMPLNSEK